jgi:protein-S-isoprenylcysteine O-methyltransferase Ste14
MAIVTTALSFLLIGLHTIGIEGRVRRREDADAATWQTTSHDRGSQRAVGVAFGVTLVLLVAAAALSVANVAVAPASGIVAACGIVLMLAGMAIRYWAVRTLGAFYTRTLRVSSGHQVVDSGPYRFVRHPGYVGTILLLGGAAVATANWVAIIVGPALVVAMYVLRIRAEETMLRSELGAHYEEYAARTSRLIPFVY